MIKATWKKYTLNFKRPSGTSRGVLHTKATYFIFLVDEDTGQTGIGECGLLQGLSFDDKPDYEEQLEQVCRNIDVFPPDKLLSWPSIRFGLEMAHKSLRSDYNFILFPSQFVDGEKNIRINGLIWMGEKEFMLSQIKEKLEQGFNCIKLKIGAIDFEEELKLLAFIRKQHPAREVEIRVDANGAFNEKEALEKLKRLSDFELHSIEQPIKAGNTESMSALCEKTLLPIALDEELIGIHKPSEKAKLLQTINPQFIILKPSLTGGFKASDEWIDQAGKHNCGWWITSALESNVGLNAIAQYTFSKNNPMPQGLGTGELYTNNFISPLLVREGHLTYDQELFWDLNPILT